MEPRRQVRSMTPKRALRIVTTTVEAVEFEDSAPPRCCIVDGEYVDCGAHDDEDEVPDVLAYQHAHRGGW